MLPKICYPTNKTNNQENPNQDKPNPDQIKTLTTLQAKPMKEPKRKPKRTMYHSISTKYSVNPSLSFT